MNSDAAYHALPRVISLMARELGWNEARKVRTLQGYNDSLRFDDYILLICIPLSFSFLSCIDI